MARFGAGLKIFKTSAAAFQGLRSSNPSAAAFAGVPLAWPWYPLGPTSCFYWASKLLRGTFWASLKTFKNPAAAFEGLRSSKPSAAAFAGIPLAWPWYLRRPHKLFLLASKLLRGTFWAGLKTFKSSAAAFEGLRSSKPSAAAFAGVPLAWPWYLRRPHKLFLLGFETATWARFGQALKPSKAPQQLSKALDVQNLPQQLSKASRLLCHGNFLGPTSCFYWASPLLRGTFWPPLQIIKTFAAAFEGLRTSKPPQQLSQASPLAWPWYLRRPHKLFLLGFETATWHVLGRP